MCIVLTFFFGPKSSCFLCGLTRKKVKVAIYTDTTVYARHISPNSPYTKCGESDDDISLRSGPSGQVLDRQTHPNCAPPRRYLSKRSVYVVPQDSQRSTNLVSLSWIDRFLKSRYRIPQTTGCSLQRQDRPNLVMCHFTFITCHFCTS